MIEELLRSFSQRPEPPNALDWLALAEAFSSDPTKAAQAFAGLPVDRQYDLVDRLRDRNSGPFAALVALLLAENAGELGEEQVRLYVLEDAARSAEWLAERAGALRTRLEIQRDRNAQIALRLGGEFDSQSELLRLRAEESRLRAQGCDRSEFAALEEVEREIVRLETRKRVLEHYDRKGRTEHLVALRAEVAEAEGARGPLEAAIVSTTAEASRLHDEVESRQGELERRRLEATALASQKTETEAAMVELDKRIAELGGPGSRASESAIRAVAETCSRLEGALGSAADGLAKWRNRLEQLADGARLAGQADLESRIRAIYRELPRDQADRILEERKG